MAALAGSAAFDIGSTLSVQGHYSGYTLGEGNALAASGNGMLGAKGISLKFALTGGLLATEILFRHHGDLKTPFTLGNFGAAAMWSAAGAHNLSLKH